MINDEEVGPRQGIQQSYKDRRKLQNPQRKRHGARNHDKSKLFARWLEEVFPNQLHSGESSDNKDGGGGGGDEDDTVQKDLILEVAGGKGELAARLCVCHQRHVILIDPRPCDIERVFKTTVLRVLPRVYKERFEKREKAEPNYVSDLFRARFRQLAQYFDSRTIASNPDIQDAVRRCSLMIGLHADGATEAIVDAALLYGKPFCVVPCCVFPSLFPQRFVVTDDGVTEVPVRTHEQFCAYLLGKDPRFRQSTLSFEGRNVCIWWDGA
jgi:hypothetical protein